MKRRVWVIRIGDHWFLRHVRELYETLASKYSSDDQPRGIMSIFPENLPSPDAVAKATPPMEANTGDLNTVF